MKYDYFVQRILRYIEEGSQVLPETEPQTEPDVYPETEPEVEPEPFDPLEHPEPGHEPRPKAGKNKEAEEFLRKRGL